MTQVTIQSPNVSIPLVSTLCKIFSFFLFHDQFLSKPVCCLNSIFISPVRCQFRQIPLYYFSPLWLTACVWNLSSLMNVDHLWNTLHIWHAYTLYFLLYLIIRVTNDNVIFSWSQFLSLSHEPDVCIFHTVHRSLTLYV